MKNYVLVPIGEVGKDTVLVKIVQLRCTIS